MNKKRKTLMLCAAMALMMSMPISAAAQIRMAPVQDMFGNEPRGMMGRGEAGNPDYGMGNQGFGQDPSAPLGSGVLMLVAAGAGYAVIKSKKSDK